MLSKTETSCDGRFRKGHSVSKKVRKLLSQKGKGRKNSLKQRKIARSLFLNNNPMRNPINKEKARIRNLGKKHSLETIEKLKIINKAKALSGEKHPNWRGGPSSLYEYIRHSYRYRLWRSDVYKRDFWTCQACKVKGCAIEAHHKKSFISILLDNNIKTYDESMNCEELWDIDNGITYCVKCHDLQ